MQSRRSPTRARQSQVPALPPLIAPWQQEQTPPNKPRPPSHTPISPSNEVSSSSSSHRGTGSQREGVTRVDSDTAKFEQLQSRVSVLERANRTILEQLAAAEAMGRRSGGEDSMKEELLRISSEIYLRLGKVEHRVSLNERSIHMEEARVSTLVQSTQEIERGILVGQKQLLARREEQGAQLEGLRESVHQLEQRQVQLGELSRHGQAGLAAEVGRVGEEVGRVKSRVENSNADIAGKLNGLEHESRILGEGLVTVDAAVARLENANVQLKRQMELRLSEMRAGCSELQGRLVKLESERKKQDLWLKESFSQLQAHIQWNSTQTQESFHSVAREMEKNSENVAAEHARLLSEVRSAIQHSRRESSEAQGSLRRELETQIRAVEEAVESERLACASRADELCSAVRSECEEARKELAREVTAALECGERGREVLQGTVSVLEEEGKAGRQELSAIVEAEIKTRHREVWGLQSETQKASQEWRSQSESLQSCLDALEERVATDREQLQTAQEALVREWQEMGVRLLSDVDSRLSALHTHITHLQDTQAEYLQRDGRQNTAEEGGHGAAGEEDRGGIPASFHREVLQWKSEVSQQLGFLQRQHSETSQRLAGLSGALRELQVKLVGTVQQETNQRFHAVLELKNELSHLAARMPLFFHQYSQSQSNPEEQQRTGVLPLHQLGCDNTALSRESFWTEEGGEGEDEVEGDYPYHHDHDGEQLQVASERFSSAGSMPEIQAYTLNRLHSKSRVVLLSNRPTRTTQQIDTKLELPHIMESVEVESPTRATPPSPLLRQQQQQQAVASNESLGECCSATESRVEGEREMSERETQEDGEDVERQTPSEEERYEQPRSETPTQSENSLQSPSPADRQGGSDEVSNEDTCTETSQDHDVTLDRSQNSTPLNEISEEQSPTDRANAPESGRPDSEADGGMLPDDRDSEADGGMLPADQDSEADGGMLPGDRDSGEHEGGEGSPDEGEVVWSIDDQS